MSGSWFKKPRFEHPPHTCSHGRIKGTLASKPELEAQSGSIEDWKAYILWEKKGKKVQFRPIPVLYARAIECAMSEDVP